MRHAKIFLELYILIRNDMEYTKTLVDECDILNLMISTDSEVVQMKNTLDLKTKTFLSFPILRSQYDYKL